ncbi:MerR family transcriptional regulator [Pontibacillus litoralis]|uniref:HTH merR-type domain-containing protein n=1 Tax=Pontibacillus litoralis JSM 072002 TaxID=1385512 RepID=A0A0A5HT04_9BACI|nr:MerR family transcriptional regulator [Pontibacillus litoralis]KGX86772.1 hypothetical protein N784_03535 [Pontibacillus litoralis JSM 072002]
MNNKYFRTGAIAKFNNVSADTVRYYDKEKLVTPSIVHNNNYRYYTLDDALKFNSVTLLRELNIPLQDIREWLTYTNMEEAITFNTEYIEVLKQQRLLLDQKIHFLQQFNKRMESFHHNPNQLEYVENDFIYLCQALSFTVDQEGFNIDEPIQDNQVDDPFWTKTSMLGFTNHSEYIHSPENGRVCCSNIIPSECDEIEEIHFDQALRFNYIGNPFSDLTYLEAIQEQVHAYCNQHRLKPASHYYELYYLYQHVNDTPSYYVHIYFPLQ